MQSGVLNSSIAQLYVQLSDGMFESWGRGLLGSLGELSGSQFSLGFTF